MLASQQLSSSLGRVIQAGIALVVLALFGGLVDKLPGVDVEIVSGFRVQEALHLVLALIMVGLVLGTTRSLANVGNHYAATLFGIYRFPERAQLSTDVGRVTDGLAYAVAIALSWAIVNQQLGVLRRAQWLQNIDWMPTVVTLAFLAALLYVLVTVYQALQPILGAVGLSLGRVVAKGSEVECPSCGTVNPGQVRFCANCGHDLSTVTSRGAANATAGVCPKCSAPLRPGARFCGSCRADLTQAAVVAQPPAPADPPRPTQGLGRVGGAAPSQSESVATSRPGPCATCGAALEVGDTFCTACGAAVTPRPA